jgi:hypothetical protein
MTDHPSTPSPELVEQWRTEGFHQDYCSPFEHAIAQAAQWGADAELEACVKWIAYHPPVPDDLRAARRPKLPSLKAQALALIDKIQGSKEMWQIDDLDVVRRALEGHGQA